MPAASDDRYDIKFRIQIFCEGFGEDGTQKKGDSYKNCRHDKNY